MISRTLGSRGKIPWGWLTVHVFLRFYVKTEVFRYDHPPFNMSSEMSIINIIRTSVTITETVDRNKLRQYYNENCIRRNKFSLLVDNMYKTGCISYLNRIH
jgi:hypothetical protein